MQKVSKTSNERIMLLSKCAACNGKKSRFIEEQETSGLWSNLGIKTSSTKIPLLDHILL